MNEQTPATTSETTPETSATEQTLSGKGTAWAAIVEHDHGTNVSVRATRDAAMDEVAAHADYWWSDEMGDEDMPQGRDEKIDAYFEKMADRESWIVMEADVSL